MCSLAAARLAGINSCCALKPCNHPHASSTPPLSRCCPNHRFRRPLKRSRQGEAPVWCCSLLVAALCCVQLLQQRTVAAAGAATPPAVYAAAPWCLVCKPVPCSQALPCVQAQPLCRKRQLHKHNGTDEALSMARLCLLIHATCCLSSAPAAATTSSATSLSRSGTLRRRRSSASWPTSSESIGAHCLQLDQSMYQLIGL